MPKTIAPPEPRPTAKRDTMKNRVVRVDDDTWDAAVARAKREGLPIADVVRHYLREYGQGADA